MRNMLEKINRQEEDDPISFFDVMPPKGIPTWDDNNAPDLEVEKLSAMWRFDC